MATMTTGADPRVLDDKNEKRTSVPPGSQSPDSEEAIEGKIINASGHVDQLHRQYSLLSICGLALTVDNAWVAVGTSLAISVYQRRTAWCYLGALDRIVLLQLYQCLHCRGMSVRVME
jgi:hypothetical protein